MGRKRYEARNCAKQWKERSEKKALRKHSSKKTEEK